MFAYITRCSLTSYRMCYAQMNTEPSSKIATKPIRKQLRPSFFYFFHFISPFFRSPHSSQMSTICTVEMRVEAEQSRAYTHKKERKTNNRTASHFFFSPVRITYIFNLSSMYCASHSLHSLDPICPSASFNVECIVLLSHECRLTQPSSHCTNVSFSHTYMRLLAL